MRPASFDYVRPASVAEACEALTAGGTVLAGGQSLVPLLKLRIVRPTRIIDLNRIDELAGITTNEAEELFIGAMTRHQDIADHPLVQSKVPLLASAARHLGDIQVRARGTIGGNICFADPRANLTTALIALDAVAVLVHTGGVRDCPVADMFTGFRQSSRRADELLIRLRIRHTPEHAQGVYLELAPQLNGTPIVNVAVVPGAPGREPRIAVGGLFDIPWRAVTIEELARTGRATEHRIREAIDEFQTDRLRFEDPRGDAAYRARIASVLIAQALERCTTGRGPEAPAQEE
ncbi:FAD binding domain-containing protein [Paraburkholderia sp. MM6662-R1]|uniref:FAD binding domain-containing protein n=1 Tax=Paraburkholderia sp. MM6662-R1 TaxID=2991066 RepID=UPI003D1B8DB8